MYIEVSVVRLKYTGTFGTYTWAQRREFERTSAEGNNCSPVRYDRGYGSRVIGAVERARKHLWRVSSVDHLLGYGKLEDEVLRHH